MEVEINKYKTRFTVKSSFNKQILEIIRKIDKRYWEVSEKAWYLPLASLDYFQKELNQIGNIAFKIQEIEKPSAEIIFDQSDTFKLTFTGYIKDFALFKQLHSFKYENRAIVLSSEQFDKVLDILKEINISCTVTSLENNETPQNKEN